MQIWIHDKSMRKVCALNNEIPGMLPYTNSQWHQYLEYSTSTLDFTIPKFVNGKLHDDIKYINDQMYVSFYYDNSYHVFYVSKLVENDFSFQVTCNNTNLELAMEVARPLADIGGAKSVEWYLQNLELLGFAGLEIGVNEISDRTRTLTFESQSGTKLERLHSLMNQFDAEFIFRTELNRDGTMKRFIIDIYQEADENHHGIGKARGDVVLYYQSGLKGVQVTSDKTQLFNAGNFIGQDGVNLNDVEFEEKNELGQVEFYSRKGTSFVFAPLSRERYPSTMNPDSADNWTRKDFQTEYKDVESLKAYALRTIKQYAYPLLTYTVDVQSSFLDNYKDINLGDTVKIIDNNFRGGLALEARVSEMIISFDNPANNSVVFTNFKKLDNKPSDALQQRIDEIVSKSLPYHVEIRTTNGTVFKNGIGRSTVKPILKQGDKIVDATYRFVIDGTIKYVGMTYDMVASEINQPTTLTISAWVDNKEVASEEVTFVNVSDGKQGPKGDNGKDGVGLKTTTIVYGLSDSDSTKPNNWSSQPPALVKGKYLWTKTIWTYTDSSSETGYQKTYIAKDGNDGNDGLPGKDGVGLVNTTVEYLKYTDGQTIPKAKYYSKFNWNGLTLPQHLKNNWVQDLTLIESGKPVKYTDLSVGEFVTDKTGEILQIKEVFGTGGGPKNPGTFNLNPSIGKWSKEIPTVPAGQYLWTRTTWFYSDGTSEQGFSVAKMGERGPKGDKGERGLQGPKGDQGIPGPKGADGKTQYTHIAYADTVSGSGFSQTDSSKAFIGMYQDFNATDSQNPQDYRWTKWKGSDGKDGIPGPKGADGRTPYVHFAYADSADGREGFSLTQTGSKRYLGVLTNFIKEDSTNPDDYTWSDTAGSISIGGRNLLNGSKGPFKPDRKPTENFDNYVYYENETSVYLEQGKQYIISAKTDGNFVNYHDGSNESDNVTLWLFTFWDVVDIVSDSKTGTTGTQFTWNHPTGTYHLRVNTYHKEAIKSVWEVKIEEGTVKTDWTPSVEDVQKDINSKADDVLTQAQLNKLNEINSVMKAELDAKASLDTLNQWVEAYQNFVNANNANRAQAEKDLADASARVTKLENDLNDMSERWNFIDSYMSASNEGLVVGKTDNSSSMLFSPNGRISMFSAGNEVMYISQGVIHIENGIFSKTIQIGRYREEQDIINPDRNVIRYVGGA